MLGTPNAPSMTLLGVSAQATATIVSARPASSWVIPPSHRGKSWRTGTISGAPTSVSPWGHRLPFWVGYHHPFPTSCPTRSRTASFCVVPCRGPGSRNQQYFADRA